MFVHQVIEDIRAYREIYRRNPNRPPEEKSFLLPWLNDLLKTMESSQKFHMGDIDAIEAICKGDIGKEIFLDKSYLRLPYDLIWLDFTFANYAQAELPAYHRQMGYSEKASNSKEGVLVQKIKEDLWMIVCFTYFKETKRWSFIPILMLAIIGGADNNENYQKLKAGLGIFKDPPTIILDQRYLDRRSPGTVLPFFMVQELQKDGELQKKIMAEYALNLALVQHSLKLLNCKNIGVVEHPPDSKLNKARTRRGKGEIFTYKTLCLRLPGGKHIRTISHESIDHNRIHLCRGHFKEYTDESPLFGKVTGLWWWQSHVRGHREEGAVVKDYRVDIIADPENRKEEYA